MSPRQQLVLFKLRGTGRYVGKDALPRDRFLDWTKLKRTLMALQRAGLAEHTSCSRWRLTEAGRDWIRGARRRPA